MEGCSISGVYKYVIDMRIEELRIGNVVKTIGRPVELSWVVSREDMVEMLYKEELGRFGDVYEGVPLTVEWLKRLGFNQSDVVVSEYYKGWFSVQCNKGILFRCNDGCIDKKRLLYVHELQNLYWCLTGEELVISDAAEKDLGK